MLLGALTVGSDAEDERAAAIHTLCRAAKLTIAPLVWLADILARLPNHTSGHTRPRTPALEAAQCFIGRATGQVARSSRWRQILDLGVEARYVSIRFSYSRSI